MVNEKAILDSDNESRPPPPIDPAVRSAAVAALLATFQDEHHATLSWLIERFPITFSPETDRIRPLKIGIDKDIMAIAATEATWLRLEVLSEVLTHWVKLPAYRFSMRQGKRRRDLFGQRYEKMSPEHRRIPKPPQLPKLLTDDEAEMWLTQFRKIVKDSRSAPDTLNSPSRMISQLRELIPSLSTAHPAREELAGLWLHLRKQRRLEIHRLREEIIGRAEHLLSPDVFAQIDVQSRTQVTDDAQALLLADEHERLAFALDENELVLMRRHLSRVDRRRMGVERESLQREMSGISKQIDVTLSLARAFAKIAGKVLPRQQFKQLSIWRNI